MKLRILSDVQAIHALRGPLPLTPTRKLLLGALLSDPKRTIDKTRLLELPPNGWQKNTRDKAISDLRTFLGENFDGQADLIGTSGTLRLELADPEVLDYHRFRRLIQEARAAKGEPALLLLNTALEECRGTPLGALDSPLIDSVRRRIDEQQRQACLDRAELRFELGQHVKALDEVLEQLTAWPEDERLIRILARALVAVGRRSDASKAFTEFDKAHNATVDLRNDVTRILDSSMTSTANLRVLPERSAPGLNAIRTITASTTGGHLRRRDLALGWAFVVVMLAFTTLMSVRDWPSMSAPQASTKGNDSVTGTLPESGIKPPARPPMVLVYRFGDEPKVAAGRNTGQDHTWIVGSDGKKELETVFRTSYPNEPVERIVGTFETSMQSPCPPVALMHWSLLVDGEERARGSLHFPASGGNLAADIASVPRDLRIRLALDSPIPFDSATPCDDVQVTLRDATVIPLQPK